MSQTEIWTEKFRPSKFEEVVGQQEIIKRIKSLAQSLNIPHFLFAGPAGTGKSTLALIVVKELFGDAWKENYIELNASDERGIDVVRQKVKDFARTKALKNVPFKVIFLDEADALTREAQQALRRTMENYTSTCRFILSCVTPDTKILLPEEVEISIDEFMKNFEAKKISKVQNFNGNTAKEDLVLASVQLNPKAIGKKALEITTMSGRKLKVTEDHRLYTDRGWKPAGEITKEDKLFIYPSLEGTPYENDSRRIIDTNKFIKFLAEREENDGFLPLNKSNTYKCLKTIDKKSIIDRIKALRSFAETGRGLTKREKEVYDIINSKPGISRLEVQKSINLTRIRTAQLLKSIETKGYLQRNKGKNKMQHFFAINKEPLVVRNFMDIRHLIEKEYNVKITYSSIKNAISEDVNHGNTDRTIGELARRGILDISYNSPQIGALARIAAFMLADGHIAKNDIRLYFSGNEKALERVREDITKLGYSNFSKIEHKKVTSVLKNRIISGTSTSFHLDARPLSLLLQYLGVPKGDKVSQKYDVPNFIQNGTKLAKREFLRSLFGCEADKPACKKYNFGAISLRQNKIKALSSNMAEFYSKLQELLKLFNIESYIETRDKKEVRTKDGQEVLTWGLIIRASNENMYKFFSRVGYCYEEGKTRLARLAAEYLRHKQRIIEQWKEKSRLIEIEVNRGSSHRNTAKIVNCSKDFVAAQLKGKKVCLPRKNFLTFGKWAEKYENGSFVQSEITNIKEIECNDVRDITCCKDHNFIANGFLSHNCNYSSRIIDPIQSRCVVFRFKMLEKKDIIEVVKKVAEREKLSLAPDAYDAICEASEGDCRKAINLLQATASIALNINAEMINMIASSSRPAGIRIVLDYALAGDFINARDKMLDVMLKESVSGTDIIKAIQKEIWALPIEPEIKVRLTEKTGETEFRMTEGSDEFVQIQALLASFVLAGQGKAI